MLRMSVVHAGMGHRVLVALAAVTWLAMPARSIAGDVRSAGTLQEAPQFGVYYDRYEPAFYTGFAPRTDDPQRLHMHLGRGNQLRVTVVIADDVLRAYAEDLLQQLNPGRVFRIRLPLDELVRRWAAQLRPADRTHMDRRHQLELVDQML